MELAFERSKKRSAILPNQEMYENHKKQKGGSVQIQAGRLQIFKTERIKRVCSLRAGQNSVLLLLRCRALLAGLNKQERRERDD